MTRFFALLALVLAGCTGAAGQCFLTFTPSSATSTAAGGDAQFSVAPSMTPCPRNAVSNNPDWLTVSFGQSTNGGVSTVGYTVKPNITGQIRTGTISVNTTQFQVTQAANVCTFSLNPATQSVSVTGGSFSVRIETSCDLNPMASAPWIVITSNPAASGNSTLTYTVAANSNLGTRTGTIQIGTAQLQITQFGTVCAFSILPTTASVSAIGGSGQFTVQTDANCSWTATSLVGWLTFTSNSGTGPGAARYSATANPSPSPRVGGVIVAGQNAVITQEGAGINFTSSSVVNAASFISGAIAPGEIVTIFGSGLGPAVALMPQVTPDGQFLTTSLGSTRVLFDGVAAPVVYASDTQVSAVVPYSLTNAARTQVVIEYQGVRSAAAGMDVKPSSIAIFTNPSNGTGQGAVLNQDSSVNSMSNPAAAGSIVQIFATGEGQTSPGGMDGKLAVMPAPAPVALPVSAQVGGLPAEVQYAGGAPGLVAGVFQVNVRIPPTTKASSAVPLTLIVGASQSPVGVTIAVQ